MANSNIQQNRNDLAFLQYTKRCIVEEPRLWLKHYEKYSKNDLKSGNVNALKCP